MQSQFYDDKIYEAQIRAGNEIIYSNFNSSITGDKKRWTMLVAQMQSGKTGTYLFTAFEMLTQNLVSNVVIFSGNREIELREQTEKGLDDFVFKYSLYLGQVMDWDERERVRKSREALSKIRVVWGSGLKKEPGFPLKKTLFIFDESHYAQNKGMQVDRFLTKMGISATGDEGLEESDNYVLSVSATPMSELSDTVHHSQTKGRVYLEPGSTYYGVTDMLENGNIVGFESEDWRETLISALRRAADADAHKYALIRMTAAPSTSGKKGMTEEEAEDLESIRLARDIATSAGWTCRFCDSDVERNPSSKINICDLEQAPDENILVFLKGKCRMGQVVPKQHIAFGMETSKHPNTDVILQSLLGRFCGHHSSKNIMVYLPAAIVSSGELEKYVRMCCGLSERRAIESIPGKAKNIVSGGTVKNDFDRIIPLKFKRIALDAETGTFKKHDILIRDIECAFNEHSSDSHAMCVFELENLNSMEQYSEIKQRFLMENAIVKSHKMDYNVATEKGNKTYKTFPQKIFNSIQQRQPLLLGASSGCIDKETGEILSRIYICYDNYPEFDFHKGDVFLITLTTKTDDSTDDVIIPKTTGREIFSHALETGATTAVNGGMLLGLKPETHCNVELMCRALRELIQLSLQPQADDSGVIYPRRINSVINDGGESTGIQMTQEVYNATKPDGEIFNRLRAEFGVELVVTLKMKKEKNVVGMKKSIEISW